VCNRTRRAVFTGYGAKGQRPTTFIPRNCGTSFSNNRLSARKEMLGLGMGAALIPKLTRGRSVSAVLPTSSVFRYSTHQPGTWSPSERISVLKLLPDGTVTRWRLQVKVTAQHSIEDGKTVWSATLMNATRVCLRCGTRSRTVIRFITTSSGRQQTATTFNSVA
jgi:hypothetical protein